MHDSELIKELEAAFEAEIKRRKQHDARYGVYKVAFKFAMEIIRILLAKSKHQTETGVKPSGK